MYLPNTDELFEQGMRLIERIYPPAETSLLRLQVPMSRQQTELQLLSETIRFERFFFVIDLLNKNIHSASGLKTWLGYEEHRFSLKDYFTCLHPDHLYILTTLAEAAIGITNSAAFPVSFSCQRYIATLALRHRDGHYLLVKRVASPFQLDERNRITAYLNEFTIIGDYAPESPMPTLQPRVMDVYGRRQDIERELRDQTTAKWSDDTQPAPFSFQQVRILRKLAYEPALMQHDIAYALKIRPATLETHNKRILQKARYYFLTELANVRDVAQFLRTSCVI